MYSVNHSSLSLSLVLPMPRLNTLYIGEHFHFCPPLIDSIERLTIPAWAHYYICAYWSITVQYPSPPIPTSGNIIEAIYHYTTIPLTHL